MNTSNCHIKQQKSLDRRKHKRIRLTPLFAEPIQIAGDEGNKNIPAIMADLSTSGVCLITYGKLVLGEKIVLNFNLKGLNVKEVRGKVHKVTENSSTYKIVILFDELQIKISKYLEKMAMDFEDCETKWTRGDFNFCFKECVYYPYCSKIVKNKFSK